MLEILVKYLIGYIFSIVFSFIFVGKVVDNMWEILKRQKKTWKGQIRSLEWQPKIIGCLETFLITSSWLVDLPHFIAVWLAFKVAGVWGRWTGEYGNLSGRDFYNVFIIGNGLSIAYAVVGAMMIEWLIPINLFLSLKHPVLNFVKFGGFARAIIVPFALILYTIIIILLIKFYNKTSSYE